MTNAAFDALFGGPPREAGDAADAAGDGPGRARSRTSPRRSCCAWRGTLHRETGAREPLPGRRRRAQLRGQRPDPARGAVRGHLDPARRGRCRRGAGRRAARPGTSSRASPRKTATASDAMQGGSTSGPRTRNEEIERFLDERRTRRTCGCADDELLDRRRRRARGREGRRLVPGPHGVRPARARRPQHPRRRRATRRCSRS